MANDFHDVRFPTDISYASSGGPEFSTEIAQLGSGYENRNQNWTYPRERWNVAYGVREQADLTTLIAFFYARRGRLYGFRFKNPDDYQATNQEIGTGDGATVAFQLVKTYTSGGQSLTRKITKPIDNANLHIYIDSVETSAFTLTDSTGIVTMDSALASGEVLTADFDFDIPVRFDTDHLPVSLDNYLARSAEVPIIEIRV